MENNSIPIGSIERSMDTNGAKRRGCRWNYKEMEWMEGVKLCAKSFKC